MAHQYYTIRVLITHMQARGHDLQCDPDVWCNNLLNLLPDGPWPNSTSTDFEEIKHVVARLQTEADIPDRDICITRVTQEEIPVSTLKKGAS